jgi:hypothetical protein
MLTISDLPVNEQALDELCLTARDVARFIAKVDDTNGPDACWLWTATNKSKYGMFWINSIGNNMEAHRVSYLLFRGPIDEGLYVCHKCDVRKCVNPAHFFLGTTQDNMDDMKDKGRQMRGERVPQAKLNPEKVVRIRELYSAGRTNCEELGREFGVEGQTISAVVKRKLWKHVP